MNIVDTNGIDYILGHNITLQDDYFLAPDVAEEVELTQLIHGRKLPPRVSEIARQKLFDERIYFHYYNKVLNKYGGRSFYNMTGFGDVSIMATLHMLAYAFQAQRASQLFDLTEHIVVYTNDNGLTAKIQKEFSNNNIYVAAVDTIR